MQPYPRPLAAASGTSEFDAGLSLGPDAAFVAPEPHGDQASQLDLLRAEATIPGSMTGFREPLAYTVAPMTKGSPTLTKEGLVKQEKLGARGAQPERLLSPKEVSEWLGVSPAWVRDHATRKQPRIPVVRLGGVLRFRPSDVLAFILKFTDQGTVQ